LDGGRHRAVCLYASLSSWSAALAVIQFSPLIRGIACLDESQNSPRGAIVGPYFRHLTRAADRSRMAAMRAQGVTTAVLCQVRGGFRRCGQTATAICQYCGRPFCEQHGVILDDGQEICSRDRCQRKRRDVERHLVYKREVARRNAEGLCGHPSCASPFAGQCSKCRGFFCARHLESRDDLVMQRGQQVRQRSSMCLHCWSRRGLWSRL
jgi:hypothetical protein